MLKMFKLSVAAIIICGSFLLLPGSSNGATFPGNISPVTTTSLTTMPSSLTQTVKNTMQNLSSQITAQIKQSAIARQNTEVNVSDVMLGVLSRDISLSLVNDSSPEQYFVDTGNSLSMFAMDFRSAADLAVSGGEPGIITINGQYGEQFQDTAYIGIIGLVGGEDSLNALNDYPGMNTERLSSLRNVGSFVLDGFGELKVLAGEIEFSGNSSVSRGKELSEENVRRESLYFCIVPLRSLLSRIMEQTGADADKKYMVAIPAEKLGPAAAEKKIKGSDANSTGFYILEITGEEIRQMVDGIVSSSGEKGEETLYSYAFESSEKEPVSSGEKNEDETSARTGQSDTGNATTEEESVYEYDSSGTDVVTDDSLTAGETDSSAVSAADSEQSTDNTARTEQEITVTTTSLTLDQLVSILSESTDDTSSDTESSCAVVSEENQTVSGDSDEELYFLTDTSTEEYVSDSLIELTEEDNSLDLPSSLVENQEIDEVNENADMGGIESSSLTFVSDYTESLSSALALSTNSAINSTVQYSVYSTLDITDIYELGDFFATEIDLLSDIWVYSSDLFSYDYIFSQVSVEESTGITLEYEDDILSAFSKIVRPEGREQGYLNSRWEEDEEGYSGFSGYREKVELNLTKLLISNTGEEGESNYYVTEQERELASYSPAGEREDDNSLTLTAKKGDEPGADNSDNEDGETAAPAADSEDKNKLDRDTSTREGMKYYREKIKENLEKLPESEEYIALELSSY